MRRLPVSAALAFLLTLSACGSTEEPASGPPLLSDIPARAAAIAQYLSGAEGIRTRPSAILGLYLSNYLAGGGLGGVESAMRGIGIQQYFAVRPSQDETSDRETYALLEKFGSLMQVDVRDMLNRSPDRAAALDAYIAELQRTGTTATQRKALLEAELNTVTEQRRTARKNLSVAQSALRNALREEQFAEAADLRAEETAAQQEVNTIEAQLDQFEGTINIFENLLEAAEERLTAIEANREVIIAGLKVVDTPGIEPFNILESGSRRRGGGGAIFGGFEGL